MESPRGLVVEQLTSVRHRVGFEELAGVSSGRPVSVGVTNPDVFSSDVASQGFADVVGRTLALAHPSLARTLAIEPAGPWRWAVLWERFAGPMVDRVLTKKKPLLPNKTITITTTITQILTQTHTQQDGGCLHSFLYT